MRDRHWNAFSSGAANQRGGRSLKIIHTEEGFSYNVSGLALIKGRKKKPLVDEVFAFIANEFSRYDKMNNLPEKIFIDQEPSLVINYPEITKSMDMTNFQDPYTKDRLLSRWQF